MSLKDQSDLMLPAIEDELKTQVARLDAPLTKPFHDMLTYHMGWTGEGAGPGAAGKRLRPLMLLLTSASTSSNANKWKNALPAAAAVELVHNFSLVHDDIQDNSQARRGRPTIWAKWGEPMAINVGDALFAISSQAMMDLSKNFHADVVLKTATSLHNTCLNLTRGQYLDMSYEKRKDLTIEDYWLMVEGKTAALLSACTHIGAILGDTDNETVEQARIFGRDLGLAFQVQDDILGIWGDEAVTGKSTMGDLVEGKNSLPVLYGLSQKGRFARRWAESAIRQDEVAEVAQMLRDEGAYDYSQREAQRLTSQALGALEKIRPSDAAGEALFELVYKLLNRES